MSARLISRAHTTRLAPEPVPHARRLGVGDAGLRAHMKIHVRRMLARQRERSEISDDQRVDARRINRLQIGGQRIDVGGVQSTLQVT